MPERDPRAEAWDAGFDAAIILVDIGATFTRLHSEGLVELLRSAKGQRDALLTGWLDGQSSGGTADA